MHKLARYRRISLASGTWCAFALLVLSPSMADPPRERICISDDWRFKKYSPDEQADMLVYDVRPEVTEKREVMLGDDQPTAAVDIQSEQPVLKSWILPTGNELMNDLSKRYTRPAGSPGSDFPFVQGTYADDSWEQIDLPHDWAIQGPFCEGWRAPVGGGMGRLPSPGVAWYRKKLDLPAADAGKSIFLDVDGAMSYAMVWLNGNLVGGWPYGYNSWRVDLTPYLIPGGENQLAIRLDNPNDSSRWYPGGGIYRNIWLVKTSSVHVAHWGTYVTTPQVTPSQATVELEVTVDNDSSQAATIDVVCEIFEADTQGHMTGLPIAQLAPMSSTISPHKNTKMKGSVTIAHPRLWGPPPEQVPNLYVAVTTVKQGDKVVDRYETRFGIRSLVFDANRGLLVNGQRVYIKGVNQHHDLGPLGGAFNVRASERQLERLREMGCNAIRTAHNPPTPEFLELTDRMGFLVMDEVFDVWERKKTPLDFHLVFPEWHEQDLRAMIRRDRNSPSVILWSFGNEVGEQYSGDSGANVAKRLYDIAKDEDPSRLTTTAMNVAKPDSSFAAVPDVISLNYQGEGIRWDGPYADLQGNKSPPQYEAFHSRFPDKLILSSENGCVLSSRGEYFFPVGEGKSAPWVDGKGASDSQQMQVSAYGLYTDQFGSSADKVFTAQEQHPFVAGGFVWAGWDYLGEPSPYYLSRSSYYGIIDLAGFSKDIYYLYQSHWRPEYPMAHILPHWTWPERVGEVTPVHVFTSGDEAELFLNGKSLGRKKKDEYEYRLRWDEVKYEPGELTVVAYKDGEPWAEEVVVTAGNPVSLTLFADRTDIRNDGRDLAFVTVSVVDDSGMVCPRAMDHLKFSIAGPGQIVATANGDPTDFVPFPSHERNAFNGHCLVIVKGVPGEAGTIRLTAASDAIESGSVEIVSQPLIDTNQH